MWCISCFIMLIRRFRTNPRFLARCKNHLLRAKVWDRVWFMGENQGGSFISKNLTQENYRIWSINKVLIRNIRNNLNTKSSNNYRTSSGSILYPWRKSILRIFYNIGTCSWHKASWKSWIEMKHLYKHFKACTYLHL